MVRAAELGKALYFASWGMIGGFAGAMLGEPMSSNFSNKPIGELIFWTAAWSAVNGGAIAFMIVFAQHRYLRRQWRWTIRVVAAIGLGIVGGFGAGIVSETMYQGIGPTETLRVLAWGIEGALVGTALSFGVPNLGRRRGFAGGAIGGLTGGVLFVIISVSEGLVDTAGRLIGTAALGFFIGLMVMLAEQMFREAWLEITFGPKESRTVTLGAEPVRIGGDSVRCAIYVRELPPIAFVYRVEAGLILCEDVGSGRTEQVQPGHQQHLGRIEVTVHARMDMDKSVQAEVTESTKRAKSTQASPGRPGVQTSPTTFHLCLPRGAVCTLTVGRQLTARDIPGLEPHTPDGIVAEVARNPNDPKILGLRNLSHTTWNVTLPNGNEHRIEKGRTVRLTADTVIDFGQASGRISHG